MPLSESQVGQPTTRNLDDVSNEVKTVLERYELVSSYRVKAPDGFYPSGMMSDWKAYSVTAPLDLIAASIWKSPLPE